MITETTLHENAEIGEKYYRIRHKSGLDIYVIPKELTTYYALFGTRYGSVDNYFKVDDDKEFTRVPDGIAHFLEHKMFENENGEDTFQRFARTGASANAYTSFTTTAYLFSCTDNFDESLEILLDYVTHPYYTDGTVEKEQGIIAQEIRMNEDSPGNRLIYGLLKSLYAAHNVRVEILGTDESISKITADLLYKCYGTFYNLSNMALCVCGRVTPEQVIAVADRVLHDQTPISIESVAKPEAPEAACARSTDRMQVSKPLFAFGVKDTAIPCDGRERMKKRAMLSLLCNLIFGKSGELYNSLYSDGLISPSFGYWLELNSSFSFLMVEGDSDDPEAVYSRIADYLARVASEGVNREDFERCRRVLYANSLKCFDSTEEIANEFLAGYIFDSGDMLEQPEVIRSLDYDDAQRLIREYFVSDRYAMSVVLPLES